MAGIEAKVIVAGVVTRVIDGDTFEARVDLGFKVYSIQRFRLHGIDCPEKDPKSTEFVSNKILNKVIMIESLKSDSFGRWLCNAVVPGDKETINDQLVGAGLAVKYLG